MVTLARPTLPLDIRLMNGVSTLVWALMVAVLMAAGLVWLARAPWFPVRSIALEGELARSSVPTVRAVVMPKLSGNFYTLDLKSAQKAFESVPWVRTAVVRRVWPHTLSARLEEHRAVALWESENGDDRLVNHFGEVFQANVGDVEDEGLPLLSGPEGSAPRLWAMYQKLRPLMSKLDLSVDRLSLSGRGSWRIELDGGSSIELGRGTDDEVVARTARFVRTISQVTRQFQNRFLSADLRYPEGYAVRLQGVTTQTPTAGARRSP